MDFDTQALTNALKTAFAMDDDDAKAVLAVLEDCFWGEAEVNDEDLDKDTRSLFYTLEAEGLLTFRRTEYKFEGATRRAFFWMLSEEVLNGEIAVAEARQPTEEEQVANLYDSLHGDVWNRDALTA